MEIVGRIVTGKFNEVYVRVKKGEAIELSDLLTVQGNRGYTILQVVDLLYGSQISEKIRNLAAGMKLEGYGDDLTFTEPELNNYVLASLKNLVDIEDNKAKTPKQLPKFFSEIKRVEKEDFAFLRKPKNPIFIGNIRSGSKELSVPVYLPSESMLRHHVLLPASTGKGKTNTVKILLSGIIENEQVGAIVIDPHDEYYGRGTVKGLSDLANVSNKIIYYTPENPPPGESTLIINISQLRPWDFTGIMNLSPPQIEALYSYYQRFGDEWIEHLVLGHDNDQLGVNTATLNVIQRKFRVFLDIRAENEALSCYGIFKDTGGESTLTDIRNEVETGKIVIIDTSVLSSKVELLVGSMVAQRIFNRYKRYKREQTLGDKPVVSVIIEEAPRVIGEGRMMEDNIFDTIAREGRKFKIGLIAITQLPSVIPKEILANINTKIILGTVMGSERRALIESASDDLSKDDQNIASLDIGEAIVTSTFTKFPIPTTIPFFDSLVKAITDKSYTGELDTKLYQLEQELSELVEPNQKRQHKQLIQCYENYKDQLYEICADCLNPQIIFQPAVNAAQATIVCSGTLSPLALTSELLGVSEAVCKSWDSIVPRENTKLITVPVDSQGAALKATHVFLKEHRSSIYTSYKKSILRIAEEIPGGVLVFCKSYKFMKRLKLSHSYKDISIYQESKNNQENNRIFEDYCGSVEQDGKALLVSVFGGKNLKARIFLMI